MMVHQVPPEELAPRVTRVLGMQELKEQQENQVTLEHLVQRVSQDTAHPEPKAIGEQLVLLVTDRRERLEHPAMVDQALQAPRAHKALEDLEERLESLALRVGATLKLHSL